MTLSTHSTLVFASDPPSSYEILSLRPLRPHCQAGGYDCYPSVDVCVSLFLDVCCELRSPSYQDDDCSGDEPACASVASFFPQEHSRWSRIYRVLTFEVPALLMYDWGLSVVARRNKQTHGASHPAAFWGMLTRHRWLEPFGIAPQTAQEPDATSCSIIQIRNDTLQYDAHETSWVPSSRMLSISLNEHGRSWMCGAFKLMERPLAFLWSPNP